MHSKREKTAGRLSLSLLLALLLMLCLGAAAWADVITTWEELQTALNAGGTVTLTQDISAGAEDDPLTVPANITVTLDLNGHILNTGIKIAGSSDLTLRDSNSTAAHDPAVPIKTRPQMRLSRSSAA